MQVVVLEYLNFLCTIYISANFNQKLGYFSTVVAPEYFTTHSLHRAHVSCSFLKYEVCISEHNCLIAFHHCAFHNYTSVLFASGSRGDVESNVEEDQKMAESLMSHQYKSFHVSMVHKLRTNTEVQLGLLTQASTIIIIINMVTVLSSLKILDAMILFGPKHQRR